MTIEQIIDAFITQKLGNKEIYSVIGTASNVDDIERTCDVEPLDGTADILGVKLQSVLNSSKGFVQIPKSNSKVIVTFLNNKTGYVAICDEVDKILIDTDLVQFNGGTDGMTDIANLTTKLNKLKTELQAELVKIQTGIAGVGGAYTPGILTAFSKTEYEDSKIKH